MDPPDLKPYLSIAAMYRDEARYLREWIEFHRLVGVERFFLYDNRSTDDHREVLAPYIADGTVVWEDYPDFPAQLQCFDHCIATHRADSRWIAFIDVDEFLFSPTGVPVAEVLRSYEEHPGVAVNLIVFGTSGHATPPDGLVIDNYRQRLGFDRPRNRWVKSIVDPTRVVSAGRTSLYFRYADGGKAVDERLRPVQGHQTDAVSVERLRINHYFTRSESERERKLAAPRVDNGEPKQREGVEERDRRLNEAYDEAILGYVPAVRAAMAAIA